MKKRQYALIEASLGVLLGLAVMIASSAQEPGSLPAPTVYVIDIRDTIGKGLKEYIHRGIQMAEENNADAIVFDIHTPGGALDATIDIIDTILRAEIPTIAYVNRNAISAGAIIALACDQLVMVPAGVIGDAAPVSMSGEEAGEKFISPVRAMISANAEDQGKNPHIAEAMVDKDLALVRLKDGEIVALLPGKYEKLEASGEEFEIISDQGKLLTLRTNQALELAFADGQAKDLYDLLRMYEIVQIGSKRRALTKSAVRKLQASGTNAYKPIYKSLADAYIHHVTATFAEKVAIFITRPEISSLLLMFGLLGLFVEFRTPGLGLPAIVGLTCFALLFGGHMIARMGGHMIMRINPGLAALAFITGIGLLLIEIFLIPGFGIAGISGIGFMLLGVLLLFGNYNDISVAVGWLSGSFILTILLAILLMQFLPKTRTWQSFVLSTEERSELGYHAPSAALHQELAGRTGKALTVLRPSGTALIDGKRIDVVTEGNFILKDTPIKVVRVEGMRVLVQAIEEA